jgi:ABC-type nitrate/sulfonate/bicarbonate transport system substrate-binding protein
MGVQSTIKDYETGTSAYDGMKNGEVDFVVASEYSIVGRAFQKDDISAIASIYKSISGYIVGRKDRGIANIGDLKGKTIGPDERRNCRVPSGQVP